MGIVAAVHSLAAIIFGILEAISGVIILTYGFVMVAKVDNVVLSPHWLGFVVCY